MSCTNWFYIIIIVFFQYLRLCLRFYVRVSCANNSHKRHCIIIHNSNPCNSYRAHARGQYEHYNTYRRILLYRLFYLYMLNLTNVWFYWKINEFWKKSSAVARYAEGCRFDPDLDRYFFVFNFLILYVYLPFPYPLKILDGTLIIIILCINILDC